MMNFDEFKDNVKDMIGDYLTDEYKEGEMKFNTIHKSNGRTYEALMISKTSEHTGIMPALNLTEAYDMYQEGASMEQICTKLADIRMNAPIPGGIDKEMLMSYEKIKDRIFPRLVNKEASAAYVVNKPHQDVEDLSVIYAVRFSEGANGFADAVIDNDLADLWGVDIDTISQDAMSNLEAQEPLCVNIEKAIMGCLASQESQLSCIDDIDPDVDVPFYILTNMQKTKGAVMAMNAKAMEKITEKLGAVYILPSSVDEVLVAPQSRCESVNELAEMVRKVNSESVDPESRLSDNIYAYDAEAHSLVMANEGPSQSSGIEMQM